MKDYGFQEYPSSFLDRHGARIGVAICAVSAGVTIACCLLIFYLMAPTAIEDLQERSAEVVASSRGVAE